MVEYIKAGEKQLPIRISYKVLKQISTLSSETEGQYDRLERLLFFSLQEGHKAAGVGFELTLDTLVDLIDDYPEILGQFNSVMGDQMDDLTGKITGGAAMKDGLNLSDSDSGTLESVSTT